MSKKAGRKPVRKSHYPLTEVMQKIDTGQYDIRQNASQCAFDHFGWETDDMIKALKLLREKHFSHSIPSTRNAYWVFDVYKARLLGEKVYIHLYIDDTRHRLVINSLKKDRPYYR